MKIKFKELEEAYEFVSFGEYGDHSALLDRSTGQIYLCSESGDLDEVPEDLWEAEHTIEIPHKNDLGAGSRLAFDFIRSHSPGDYGTVQRIFSKRGAYSRYKGLLESKGLLQDWYDYEEEAQRAALRKWCEDNEIELTG